DADDTAGALLALLTLRPGGMDKKLRTSGVMGVTWLLDLQNRDGGIPTFCRGWGALPFDRSSPDLTAHAMRAWCAWREFLPLPLQQRIDAAIPGALNFLERSQRTDGSWAPLWFGNEHAHDEENRTYGTSRLVLALEDVAARGI